MRLSRTDLVPTLAIVAGGAIGASLSFSLLGRSPEPVSATYGSVEVVRVERAVERLEATHRLLEREQERREEAILRRMIEVNRVFAGLILGDDLKREPIR